MRKLPLLLAGVVLSVAPLSQASAKVLRWDEFNSERGTYVLRQDIRFDEGPVLVKGQKFTLEELRGLEGLPMFIVVLKAQECADPQLQTDLVIVKPEEPVSALEAHDNSVGVQLRPGCTAEVYVETVDYSSTSLFEE